MFFDFLCFPGFPPPNSYPLWRVCVWVCECRTWPWLNPIQRWSLVLSILFSVFIVSLRGLIKVNKFLSFFLALYLSHSLSLSPSISVSCLLSFFPSLYLLFAFNLASPSIRCLQQQFELQFPHTHTSPDSDRARREFARCALRAVINACSQDAAIFG